MLRLLTIALPLVVAFLATFDEEVDALQLEVHSPLQFQVRSPPEFRPLRPAATRDQHDSPATAHSTPHARHPPSAHITMDAPRRYNPGKTTHPTIYFVTKTNLFRAPSTGVPPATHAEQLRPALPLRARGRCTCCTRTRDVCSRACPTPQTPRPPRRDATCTGHRHVRARRLACFADGLRVAPPVQAAAAACGRARRPPRPRHLGHDRQARRRHHGHAAGTPAGSAACACEACACEACEPGALVLEGAAPSAHCSTRSPSSTSPSTPAWSSAP